MKKDIHPVYGPVAFRDSATGHTFVTRSTMADRAERTVIIDGETVPVVDVDITSGSHPFWTGRARTIDTEGRVQAFQRRYGGRK